MAKKNIQSRVEKRNKRVSRRKKLLWIFIPLLFLLSIVAIYGTYLINKVDNAVTESYESDGRDKSNLREDIVDPSGDNVSVLFIGVDDSEKREESTSRSDALILATLNKQDKSVKLLSIPRDSYVYVPEVGYNTKINHAHAYGGPKATIETVEDFLDIPVDYYVRMDFEAFIDVVDALNGIEVNVPYEMREQNSKDQQGAIHLLPGEQELNGEEALALARTRKQDNDIERGKRQQEIIKAVMQKAVSINSILKYDDVIDAVGDNMTTNMTFDQMKSFISYGTSGNINMESLSLAGRDSRINGVYYYQLDDQHLTETKETLKNHLGITE